MLMYSFGRRIIFGLPAWRRVQQKARPPSYIPGAQLPRPSQASSACTLLGPPSSSRCRGVRPPVLMALRPCHGDSRDAGERRRRQRLQHEGPDSGTQTSSVPWILRPRPVSLRPLFMAATQSFYPEVAYAQMVYGASIVSFLGGARWGFAIPAGSPAKPDWMNLGNSVVPSLLAWLALLCRDNITEGALVVIMGLGLSLHYDLSVLPGYPAWFRAMRTVLTLVATFSLVATLLLKRVCVERKLKEMGK